MAVRGPPALPRTLHTTLENHTGAVHVARYAKGAAKYILTGGQDRTIRLWNPNLGTEIKAYKGHGYEVLSITVSPDNGRFASSGGDRTVFLWDVATGNTIRRISGHLARVNVVEFNYDASIVASGGFDSTVKLWDLRAQNRQPIHNLDEARDAIQTLHVGSTMIISGSVDGQVRTYDLRKGELRSDYIGNPVTSVVPTADGQTYLVQSLDSTIRLMDADNGKLLNTFKGHVNDSYRSRACFGHAEASVVSGDEEGRVWAWDLVDATPLAPNPPPKVHEKLITWVEHHPIEANEMITASSDGTAKVWRTPIQADNNVAPD
ncbi:WD40-repeat-containing domain protein [Hysterangium stoloniferum]|nr:WD40-repeat-containing domain protein [Hysterangium stoloniferum]